MGPGLPLRQPAAALEAVIDTLLQAAIQEIGADRGSLFLHDDETGELYTYVSTGLGSRQIRLLDDLGIAGAVFHKIPFAFKPAVNISPRIPGPEADVAKYAMNPG